jgi:copper chaperone CopZ
MEENCYVEPLYKNMPSTAQMQNAKQVTLFVSGMGCPNCATRVHNKLISLDGVFGVDVYLHMALAVVIYDTSVLSPDQLTGAVAQAGNDGRHDYRAQLLTAE